MPGANDLRLIIVPLDTSSPLNDSVPDARDGLRALELAKEMLRQGVAPRDVLAKLAVKFGADTVIEAICRAVGQDNFRRAALKGRLYGTNADPEAAS